MYNVHVKLYVFFHAVPFGVRGWFRGKRLLLGIDFASLEAVGLEESHDGHSWGQRPRLATPRRHVTLVP